MGLFDFLTGKRQADTRKQRNRPPQVRIRSITQAAETGRLESSWGVNPTTVDAQIYQEWTPVVARSRKAAEDYDHFGKYQQLIRDNVAGPMGFNLNAAIRDPSGTIDTLASNAIEDAWDEFSKLEFFDSSGTLSRTDAERMLLMSWATDGEVILVKRYGKKFPHGFAVQIIDPVRLDPRHYGPLRNGNVIRHGIEMDSDNRRIAYHFRNYDEMQAGYLTTSRGDDYTVVPTEDVIHWFIPEKPGQKRGLPPGRRALWRLRMLSGFEDAAIVNARVGASKMGLFKNLDGDNEDDEPLEMDAEPGTFEDIGNREFAQWTPQFPEQSMEPFIKALVRSVGAGLNVSYHNLANDLTSVNFSSIRQGALDERDVWKGLQNSFIDGVVIPIYDSWLKAALLNQVIVVPSRSGPKPLPFEKLDKYKSVSFTGKRWAWIDPAAEQSANEKAVAQGFKSRSEVIRETSNRDPEDVWDEIERENAELAKRGIVPLIPSGSVPPTQAGGGDPGGAAGA
jgi:lambda family phage portal protein